MFRRFIFAFILIAGFAQTYAQDFNINDVLVSSNTSNIQDPEYNTTLNKVCWISPENELWICNLDPITHQLVPPDGKGLKIADSLRPFAPGGWNGPEWMLSAQNTRVAYTKMVNGISYPAIASMGPMQWTNQVLPYSGCVYTMATHNYNDADAMMLFETFSNDGIHWLSTANLSTVYNYLGATLGFFANTGSQICAVSKQTEQPGFIETNAILPYFSPVSDDTAAAPFMWDDPATGKRMFMCRTQRGKQLKIFIEQEPNRWWPYNRFYSPAEPPYDYINSPEPFVFGGKSYISFAASTSGTGNQMPPAQIWIASVNPDEMMFRRISDPAIPVCVDPEPVLFEDEAFIYYTEKFLIDNTNYRLRVRKCDTGLPNPYLHSLVSERYDDKIAIVPNPVHGITTFSVNCTLTGDAMIELRDLTGKICLKEKMDNAALTVNLSFLTPAVYFVRIIDGNNTFSGKFVVSGY